jgi:hypothetical protein
MPHFNREFGVTFWPEAPYVESADMVAHPTGRKFAKPIPVLEK